MNKKIKLPPQSLKLILLSRRRNGFTLMVVISIIAILAMIGIPRLNLYLLQEHLNEAKPYLMRIAAREKARFNERGFYLQTNDENDIYRELVDDLRSAGDFCFMVVCKGTMLNGEFIPHSRCESCANNDCSSFNSDVDSSVDYISKSETGDLPTDQDQQEFEVWAVLRNTNTLTPINTWGSQSCQVQTAGIGTDTTGKQPARGWVSSADTPDEADTGIQGRVVVLRYPPPQDGVDLVDGNYHTIKYDWLNGISISDAMQE